MPTSARPAAEPAERGMATVARERFWFVTSLSRVSDSAGGQMIDNMAKAMGITDRCDRLDPSELALALQQAEEEGIRGVAGVLKLPRGVFVFGAEAFHACRSYVAVAEGLASSGVADLFNREFLLGHWKIPCLSLRTVEEMLQDQRLKVPAWRAMQAFMRDHGDGEDHG